MQEVSPEKENEEVEVVTEESASTQEVETAERHSLAEGRDDSSAQRNDVSHLVSRVYRL